MIKMIRVVPDEIFSLHVAREKKACISSSCKILDNSFLNLNFHIMMSVDTRDQVEQ